MNGVFITGTDTGVGKTLVAAAVLQRLAHTGLRVVGYKPVAAGEHHVDGKWHNEDVDALHAASNIACSVDQIGPCVLRTPCAPHIAAEYEGRPISRQALIDGANALAARADFVVVEGAGGWRVPLGEAFDSADLVVDLGVPVLLVVGIRLGCLNHALLTAESIAARGVRLAGWIANRVDLDMLYADENVATLDRWLASRYNARRVGDVPKLESPTVDQAASRLDERALLGALNIEIASDFLTLDSKSR